MNLLLSNFPSSSLLKSRYNNGSVLQMNYDDAKIYLFYLIKNAIKNTYMDPSTFCLYMDIKDNFHLNRYKRLKKSSHKKIDDLNRSSNKKFHEFNKGLLNKDRFIVFNYIFSKHLTELTIINLTGFISTDQDFQYNHIFQDQNIDNLVLLDSKCIDLNLLYDYNRYYYKNNVANNNYAIDNITDEHNHAIDDITDEYDYANDDITDEYNYANDDITEEYNHVNDDITEEYHYVNDDTDEYDYSNNNITDEYYINNENIDYRSIDKYFWNKYNGIYTINNEDGITYKDLSKAVIFAKATKFDVWLESLESVENIKLEKINNGYKLTVYLKFYRYI